MTSCRDTPLGGVYEVLRGLSDERRFPGIQPIGRYPIHIVVKNGRTLLLGVVDSAAILAVHHLDFHGKGEYDSLQLQLNRRMSNAFSFNVAYTWSKFEDDIASPQTPCPGLDYESCSSWDSSGRLRISTFRTTSR